MEVYLWEDDEAGERRMLCCASSFVLYILRRIIRKQAKNANKDVVKRIDDDDSDVAN